MSFLDAGQPADALPRQDAKAVARGQAVYTAEYAACHGRSLEGAPEWRRRDPEGFLPAPPQNASGHTWHHPDEQLIDLVTRGTAEVFGQGYQSRMPGYGDRLTEAQVREVLAYIKSTWSPHTIAAHDDIKARAASQ